MALEQKETDIIVTERKDLDISLDNDKQDIISHFTKKEVIFLLSRLPPNYNAVLFQFLWRTGVRVSEAINIKKNNLDFENQEITIRWLKNRKALYRVIPMHTSLKNLLYIYCCKLLDQNKLFPISRQMVDNLSKKYGFGHAHKLRHSFAINFLRQSDSSMALIELKDLLGHSNIQTTMEYLKIVPMNTKKAIERIDFD